MSPAGPPPVQLTQDVVGGDGVNRVDGGTVEDLLDAGPARVGHGPAQEVFPPGPPSANRPLLIGETDPVGPSRT